MTANNQHFDCIFFIYKDGFWLGFGRKWMEHEMQAYRYATYEKAQEVCVQYPGSKVIQRFLLPG